MIGPMIGADEVCDAGRLTFQTWFPSVSAEIRAAGGAHLPQVTTYDMPSADALRTGAAALPAVVFSSPGLVGQPVRDEDGRYSATWALVATVFTRGDSYEDTAQQVRDFAKAVRVCFLQHPSLGDFADELTWVGEEYDALEDRSARTVGAGFITFNVTVSDVTDAYAGPLTPPLPPVTPISTPVTVATTDLAVEELP